MFHRSSTWKPNTHIHSHTLAGTQYAVVECQETDATTYRQETVIVFSTEQMCIFRPVKSETRAGYAVFIFSVRTGLLNQWFADHMRAMQLHVVPNFHQLIVVAVKASFCPPSYFNTCARSTTDKSPSNVRQSPAESFSRSAGIRPQAASFLQPIKNNKAKACDSDTVKEMFFCRIIST